MVFPVLLDVSASAMTVAAAVRNVAEKYEIPYHNLRAVVDVESNGIVSTIVSGKPEPLIRWEGHYFDARLTGVERDRARREGLASPIAQKIPNPANQQNRWDRLLLPGARINHRAAYESCSWGLGQVMGSHWQSFGYGNVDVLVAVARSGVEGQIELMMQFCVRNNLIQFLQFGDFTAFARAYNGPAYAKHNYDGRMREAANRLAALKTTTVIDRPPSVEMLRIGSNGLRVREAQTLLVRAGYPLKVDGDFGLITQRATRAFQLELSLFVDGIIGPETWGALDAFRSEPSEQPGKVSPSDAVTVTPEGRQGAFIMIVGVLVTGIANLSPEGAQALVAGIGAIVALVGTLWATYGWQKANQTD